MAPKRHAASSTAPTAAASSTSTSATPSTTKTTAPSTSSLSPSSPSHEIVRHVWKRYLEQTPQRTLLLDAFMAFLVLVGVIQFVYCVLAGNYPFNAFLSGFCAAVGQFVLTASLRMQTSDTGRNESNKPTSLKGKAAAKVEKEDAPRVSSERAFADYVFGSLILHFFCINFIN
ncbi:hypothetical protein VTN00DRAFT_7726 [Thermoascus crustaceus]|uniref:uncharacterized protein n=1 Tax=Thermoascus crustaceus TaxID=5088 RepID=UPI003743BFE2